MRRFFLSVGRFAVTLLIVALGAIVAWQFWVYYMVEPWTRDGRVRADIVGVTPDVSGLVAEVLVHDNQQVRKAAVLFRIDRARFELALRQAEAAVASKRATWDESVRERKRFLALSNLAVSAEKQEQVITTATESGAAYEQAVADRDLAKLNLDRTDVVAPVNGAITDFSLQPGDYVSVGKPVAALVDSDSFYVAGYFEETKLSRIHIGDKVLVRIVGEPHALEGHVESFATGIEDRERAASSTLLPNVNPTFNWVRLAQRVPVRVAIDKLPPDVRLVAGRTATVTVQPGTGVAAEHAEQ
jgi:RND family efflux transporter MFP subunit